MSCSACDLPHIQASVQQTKHCLPNTVIQLCSCDDHVARDVQRDYSYNQGKVKEKVEKFNLPVFFFKKVFIEESLGGIFSFIRFSGNKTSK